MTSEPAAKKTQTVMLYICIIYTVNVHIHILYSILLMEEILHHQRSQTSTMLLVAFGSSGSSEETLCVQTQHHSPKTLW